MHRMAGGGQNSNKQCLKITRLAASRRSGWDRRGLISLCCWTSAARRRSICSISLHWFLRAARARRAALILPRLLTGTSAVARGRRPGQRQNRRTTLLKRASRRQMAMAWRRRFCSRYPELPSVPACSFYVCTFVTLHFIHFRMDGRTGSVAAWRRRGQAAPHCWSISPCSLRTSLRSPFYCRTVATPLSRAPRILPSHLLSKISCTLFH